MTRSLGSRESHFPNVSIDKKPQLPGRVRLVNKYWLAMKLRTLASGMALGAFSSMLNKRRIVQTWPLITPGGITQFHFLSISFLEQMLNLENAGLWQEQQRFFFRVMPKYGLRFFSMRHEWNMKTGKTHWYNYSHKQVVIERELLRWEFRFRLTLALPKANKHNGERSLGELGTFCIYSIPWNNN